MISGIKEWVLTLCAVMLCASVLDMLAVGSKNEKTIRLCVSAMTLCTLLLPIKSLTDGFTDYHFSLSGKAAEKTDELASCIASQADRVVRSAAEGLLRQSLGSLLDDSDNISVITDIAQDGCISIERVRIERHSGTVLSEAEIVSRAAEALGITADRVELIS